MKVILYADGQALLAESGKETYFMMKNIIRVGKVFEMNVNVGKTKVIKIGDNSLSIPIYKYNK